MGVNSLYLFEKLKHNHMPAIRLLIIEDNIYVGEELRTKLNQWGYNVIGIARKAKDAFYYFNSFPLDLIIIDIELQGSSMQGTDIAIAMRKKRNIPILFFTGVEDDALLAKTCIADPVRFMKKGDNDISLKMNLASLGNQLETKSTIMIRNREAQERLHYGDIIWCESSRGCTVIYLKNGEKRTYPSEIGRFLTQAPESILRVHRSHAVSVNCIRGVHKKNPWRVIVGLPDEEPICELNVSDTYRSVLQAVL
jgi:DNA-binding LytR/AlgR family response regulator